MAESDEPRVIKRYANRKLYDTVDRRFTSVARIGELIDDGATIVVLDHETSADRTDEVLSQILGRRAKERSSSGGGLLSELLRTPTDTARAVIDAINDEPERDAKKKAEEAKAQESEQQQEEIRELRQQVSELTKAVSVLLQDRLNESEAPADPD